MKHVRRKPDGPTLCGAVTDEPTISIAIGYWGPDGLGWPETCRECHRIDAGCLIDMKRVTPPRRRKPREVN